MSPRITRKDDVMTRDPHIQKLIKRAKEAQRLSAAEEQQLIRAWRQRSDRRAMQRLIECNLRHVVFTALQYRGYGMAVSDLISEGSVGLMKALERFDENAGARFATYALYWIRAEMVGWITGSWSMMSGSGALHSRLFFRLRRERTKLESRDTDGGVCAELSRQFRVSEERMEQLLGQLDARGSSLDSDGLAYDAVFGEYIQHRESQERELAHHEEARHLRCAIGRVRSRLNARECLILDQRLLADGEDELTLNQLGVRLGVSRERVRQLEDRVKDKLKQELLRGASAMRPSSVELAA
jgi:RNA polymerase sigma-32 factor